MSGQAILIGGTSHTGKSTLAQSFGAALGWPVISTDDLARHPGRPWPRPKPHVTECYTKLSTETLVTLLHHHHQTLRPLLVQKAEAGPVVIEGNAVRPEFWPNPVPHICLRLCLIGSERDLTQRINHSAVGTGHLKNVTLVESFLARTLHDQNHLLTAAQKYGWDIASLSDSVTADDLVPYYLCLKECQKKRI